MQPRYYDVYVLTALFIYSSLFSMPRLNINRAFDLISSGASRGKFEEVIYSSMCAVEEFVNFTLNPQSK